STHSATLFGLTRWGPGHCLTSPVLAMWRHQLIAEAMALPTGMPRSKWRCRAARSMIERCHAALRLAGNLSIQFCLPGTFSRAPMLALPSDVLAQVVTCRILQGRTRPQGAPMQDPITDRDIRRHVRDALEAGEYAEAFDHEAIVRDI